MANAAGHLELVRLLLKSGADLEAADTDGWTLLLFASCEGHADVVRCLLEAGANSHATNADGDVASDLAGTGTGHSGGVAESVRSLLNDALALRRAALEKAAAARPPPAVEASAVQGAGDAALLRRPGVDVAAKQRPANADGGAHHSTLRPVFSALAVSVRAGLLSRDALLDIGIKLLGPPPGGPRFADDLLALARAWASAAGEEAGAGAITRVAARVAGVALS